MPISSIAQVLIRLIALQWIIVNAVQIISLFLTVSAGGRNWVAGEITLLIPNALYVVMGWLGWLLAPKIARLISAGLDSEISFQGVTLEQLFTTTFAGLGVYFAVASIGPIFSWLHYFVTTRNEMPGTQNYYDLYQTVITFLAGIILILAARRLAQKLSSPITATVSR